MFRSGVSLRHAQLLIHSPPTRISIPLLSRHSQHVLHQQPPPLQQSSFSTNASRHNKHPDSSAKTAKNDEYPSPNTTSTDPEIPSFSLECLGISKNMKRVVVGLICIFGTMEAYACYLWISNRYYGGGADKEAEGVVER